MHVAYGALGSFATATDVVLGRHALEVDVPAVKLVLSHDEFGSNCGSRIDDGISDLSYDVSALVLAFFAMILSFLG